TKEGKLVGTTYITFSGGLGEIHSLVVDPAYQHRGVGTALIRRAETIAASYNLHSIRLTAPSNLKGALVFYEKLGYKQSACIPNGLLGFDWIIFTKQLCQPKYSWLKS
ncbi:MAG: GNAT family N-acetyltransferase, partial [Promethearchaeota archaeon]